VILTLVALFYKIATSFEWLLLLKRMGLALFKKEAKALDFSNDITIRHAHRLDKTRIQVTQYQDPISTTLIRL
jgi:hypothetical protein